MILLTRPYRGAVPGQVVQFDAPTEASLVQQGYGTVSVAAPTAGAQTSGDGIREGAFAFPIGAASVVITHPECTPQSVVTAVLSQAAADGTLLRVERVVPAAGSFTIYGTANATAVTRGTWMLSNIPGSIRN